MKLTDIYNSIKEEMSDEDIVAILKKQLDPKSTVKVNKPVVKPNVIYTDKVNEGHIEINGKTVKTYTQNGDKSYNVTYDDGTTDVIAVSNDAWDEINILHMNATKVNEMDMNDPIMMKLRAKKDTKPTTPIKPTTKAPNQNQSKIDQLLQQRDDIIRDMEQEAEPEGGPIADEYADKLRMIDIALRKLKNQNMNEEFKRMQELAGI